jgi:glycyl-tRNA synthetase beta chain
VKPPETGNSKVETGNSKLETGNSKLENRKSKVEIGSSVVLEEQSTIIVDEQSAIDNRQSAIMEEVQPVFSNRQSAILLPLLLEVGCEEIPARFLRDAEKGLGERVLAAVREARLLPVSSDAAMPAGLGAAQSPIINRQSQIGTYSTPRRLVVNVSALSPQQPDKVEEILGPPVKVAIDAAGKYTRAAESFAQKNSVGIEQLARTKTPKGEYLSLRKTTLGRPAIDVLAEILPDAILGLTFPKSMYWTGKSAPRFVRPIRWVVCQFGEGKDAATVKFQFLGVKSSNFTLGHRAKSRKSMPVSDFKDYIRKLRQSFVEIDYAGRKFRVIDGARGVEGEAGGKVVADDWLADWIANSTEWPRPMLGSFDARFLHLPREILITVMRDHQRYFALEDAAGNLRPHFVATLNMDSDEKGLIRQGHERVLTARFRDAEFFWNADQKVPLRDRIPLLDKVTYQAKLGSYGDKVLRMREIAEAISVTLESSGCLKPGQAEQVSRAVDLCKCDLTAQMVQEFTELQGIVGGLYAKAQGEPEEVSTAIYDHYLPLGVEGSSPRTLVGALVSLADKVDTVVGGFVAGLEPTGSRDPFALRRAGNGIIRILAEFNIPIDIAILEMFSLRTHGRSAIKDVHFDPIRNFLDERLKFYLETVGECRHDTVKAVMALGTGLPAEELRRARALEKIRDTDDYLALAQAAKRTRNILRKSAPDEDYLRGALNPDLFREEAEVELHEAYASVFHTASGQQVAANDYETILALTARLRPAIDKFFDQVLVMHEDPAIRKNRLLLLALLDQQVFSRVADLSEIGSNVDASTLPRG